MIRFLILMVMTAVVILGAEELGHPRLVFTSDQLPELRRRAATPAGQAILARTRGLLAGDFTTWHAAGYGFLYQITGEQVHADAARAAVERMLAGEANPDPRYTFTTAREHMRLGPVLSALALAYDFCHDGWDEAFRRRVLEGIIGHPGFTGIASSPNHHPGVNHWGPTTGAMAVALLGINGDPLLEPDEQQMIYEALQLAITNANREFTEGFGPRGAYGEGHYTGRISANTGLLPYMIAMRSAMGIDLPDYFPDSPWISGRWIMELSRFSNGELRSLQRGMYARDPFPRGTMLSADGDFVFGFAVLPPQQRRALHWVWQHVVLPTLPESDYDVLEYPHLGAYALAYWPIDEEPLHPGEVLAPALHDPSNHLITLRNGWSEVAGTDIVVSALLGAGPDHGRGLSVNGSVWILAADQRYEFPGMFHISAPSVLDLDPAQRRLRVVARANPAFGLGNRRTEWIERIASADTTLIVDLDDGREDGIRGLIAMCGPQAGMVAVDARPRSTWGGDNLGWGSALSIHDPAAEVPVDPITLLGPGVHPLDAPAGLYTWAIVHAGTVIYCCVVTDQPKTPQLQADGLIIGRRQLILEGATMTLRHLPSSP